MSKAKAQRPVQPSLGGFSTPGHQRCWWLLDQARELGMEPSYSVWADLLNKFHTAPVAIQALWLVAASLTTMHAARVAGQVLMEALRIMGANRQGDADCTIYRMPDGRWVLLKRGEIRELTAEDVARLPRST
jgi:hypothetical protein